MKSLPTSKLFELMQDTMGMLCFPRAVNIAYWVLQTAKIPGVVAEFGCHEGRTATFLSALTEKPVWLFDSFQGLPKPSEHDPQDDSVFREGAMATDPAGVRERFARFGLPAPKIIKGFFDQLGPERLPEAIAFAHLDGDFYPSISASLWRAYFALSPGGVIIVDDYQWDTLPGVEQAVTKFCRTDAVQPVPLYGPDGVECHQALIRKPSSGAASRQAARASRLLA
jgi:O-methyltransferase